MAVMVAAGGVVLAVPPLRSLVAPSGATWPAVAVSVFVVIPLVTVRRSRSPSGSAGPCW